MPVPSEQKATIDYLTQYGFVDAVLDNNILKFKNYNGDDVKEVQLSGFVQEQSDWNETNDKSETYIKNKPTKLSQFENDLNLEVQDASTTQKGIIQIATDDDIAAGTNETKAVTPKQLKNASSDVKPTTETLTVENTSWVALTDSSPYTYSATVTATTTIGVDSIVELINNQAVLFATYGFVIGGISGQNITIYSIGQPSENVTLTVEVTE